MSRPIVEFHAVHKIFHTGLVWRKRIDALKNVTLSIPRGSVFGVIGPNRAGKTTLVKALLSLCQPTSGRIVRLERPADDRSTLARVGYVHEAQSFPQYLTAESLLYYYGGLSFTPAHDLKRRVPMLLDQVNLADRAHEPISAYSKGMVQRLALAQALVCDPELLVLDEPSEGMDLLARKLLHEVVDRHRRGGKTVLLVSHSLSDVWKLCDHVAVVREGELKFDGTPAQLIDHHADGVHRHNEDRDSHHRETDPEISSEDLQDALEPIYVGSTT